MSNNKTIQQDISKIISEHLPAQTGTILKERLEQAEKDAEKVEELEKKLEASNKEVKRLENNLSGHTSIDEKQKKLDKDRQELTDWENRKELELTKIKLSESEKRADIIHDYTATLVKNPIVRRTLHKDVMKHYTDRYNQGGGYDTVEDGFDETTTQDEQVIE